MISIPSRMNAAYDRLLSRKAIPRDKIGYYRKWLRYYWDFCHKYGYNLHEEQSLSAFITKLKEKRQSKPLREQARHAVSVFQETGQSKHSAAAEKPSLKSSAADNGWSKPASYLAENRDTAAYCRGEPASPGILKEKGADWTSVYGELESAIKTRHYSPRTLKCYRGWARQFQAYVKSKDRELITTDDVNEFLSYLAVKKQVSASSQNQAFNALLFLFRHVLGKDFGKIEDVVRAKRKPYIPVVLNREEIDRIISYLKPPYSLIVQLLYGCGLRLSECLERRVQDFNFDTGILTVHDGKGGKDRGVPIPQTLVPELKDQLETVMDLHQRDLDDGYAGVFLYGQLEKKYKNAARELTWQWFFPATLLTEVPDTGERKRYHIHETKVQKAIRRAVKKAGTPKRATAHTFRHSFASHLLQANYDIRTIQELLGHSDVRTTMIYTHTVKSVTIKEARSPLDF